MSIEPAFATYLRELVVEHVSRHFSPSLADAVLTTAIEFGRWEDVSKQTGAKICIPVDLSSREGLLYADPWHADFNGTTVAMWNRVPQPGPAWLAFPHDKQPLWYRNSTGTLIPAWNLYDSAFSLMTCQEEQANGQRDRHGRFVAQFSPRTGLNLLEHPSINEYFTVLASACLGLKQGSDPIINLAGHVKPPTVVLSHDNDILLGNDAWTQGVRLFRTIAPMARLRLPALRNLGWMVNNAVNPRKYYFDNVRGMIDVERMNDARSSLYFLNGTGGRFGARSGPEILEEAAAQIDPPWQVGMHYNYDTFLDADRFRRQMDDLSALVKQPVVSGRAHYLRYDPERSPAFLHTMGIRFDESAGYPDRIGYRYGVAGAFHPWDPATRQSVPLWEIPLIMMDGTLVAQYGNQAETVFERHLQHLSCIGGALTLLFHPGVFWNPEVPEARGLYYRLLRKARHMGAKAMDCISYVASRGEAG